MIFYDINIQGSPTKNYNRRFLTFASRCLARSVGEIICSNERINRPFSETRKDGVCT